VDLDVPAFDVILQRLLRVILQRLLRDLLGPVRIAENIPDEANGLILAGLELVAGEFQASG